jgi:ribosomal protein L40E
VTSLNVHAILVAKPRTHRVCTKCGARKPLHAFYRNRRNLTDGRRADCIACYHARVKARGEGRAGG